MAGRRDNGAGYIFKRSDGKGWRGRIAEGRNADGKIKYKFFTGKTEAEVKKKIREYHKSGDVELERKTVTAGEYIENWLHTYKKGTLKPSSYDRLENTINHQVIPSIGDIQLQALSSDDIQRMITSLQADGKSYSTIKKAYDCVNAVLNHAVIADDIIKNPMLLVQMPEKKIFGKHEVRAFTKEEALAIVEEASRTYSTGKPIYANGDAFILMLNTGIRIGELSALRKSDWDEEKQELHVRQTAVKVKQRDEDGEATGGYTLASNTTKTYSGDRIIPLNKTATEALQRIVKKRPGSEMLFSDSDKPVDPHNLQKSFYSILANVGIEKTGIHALRHTFASFLFAKGVDVKTVSKILGHANIQITLNTYIHMIKDADKNAVKQLDDIY